MRIIESKRNPQTGEKYHYCPKTQGVVTQEDCQSCYGLARDKRAEIEQLAASYRIHCPFGEPVKALLPSHIEDQIPQNWGTDKFDLNRFSVIEPKLDGVRAIMLITETGIRVFGRRNNRFGDQSEFTENVPHLANLRLPELEGTILDGEIICLANGASASGNIPVGALGATMAVVGSSSEQAIKTQKQSGWAHVYVFDMPKYKGEDYTNHPWQYRREPLQSMFDLVLPVQVKQFIHLMPSYHAKLASEKRELYKQFLAKDAEGCVLKDPNAKYYDLRASLKVKQDVTLDAMVTGFEYGTRGGKYQGTIGALSVSVIDRVTGTLREICKVVPGSDVTRAELYQRLAGKTTEQIVGEKIIVWLQSQGWSKDYRMRHPRILEYSLDRDTPSVIDFQQVRRI